MPRLAQRAKRRVVARLLEVARHAESRYVKGLRAVVRDVHEQTLAFIAERSDASLPASFDLHFATVIAAVPAKVGPMFDRTAASVSTANRAALKVIGIKAHSDIRLAGEIAKRRDENIDLVVNAGRVYAEQVKDIFSDPENVGKTVDDLKAQLLERGDVSESRAELIARDQTLKLNGAITQIRQENAGVQEYIWSTSLDERVREEHAALEGQTFSWFAPPEPGHPGEDFQCRCVALPVIDELADL